MTTEPKSRSSVTLPTVVFALLLFLFAGVATVDYWPGPQRAFLSDNSTLSRVSGGECVRGRLHLSAERLVQRVDQRIALLVFGDRASYMLVLDLGICSYH